MSVVLALMLPRSMRRSSNSHPRMFGMPLNFANIIALPLMLGVGVAFKIYFVMAWRHGQTSLLQSSLTHAVLFSAATTATAFGSLWLSHHPGTSSMGRLLALSLFCTLIGAVVFQPVLMGKPRQLCAIHRRRFQCVRGHGMAQSSAISGSDWPRAARHPTT